MSICINSLRLLVFLFLINICVTCKDTSQKEKHKSLCNNDKIIHLRQGQDRLYLSFGGGYKGISLKGIQIEQIRDTKIIKNIKYTYNDKFPHEIRLVDKLSLTSDDSLKITFKNNKNILSY